MPLTAKEDVVKHIREHLTYPGKKSELVKACNSISDVPTTDKESFERNLPDRTHYTADKVIRALNL